MKVLHTVTELVATLVLMAPNVSRAGGHRAPGNAEHGSEERLVVGGWKRRPPERVQFGHRAPADLPQWYSV